MTGVGLEREITVSSPRSCRPTICLNMIVRNEAHVIAATLDTVSPLIDCWVIVDTGSTDETRAVVRAYFSDRGIPGELHERPWRNFGENRTEALALARGKADYIWVVDADDLVAGTLDLSALTLDCYQLRFGDDFVYWRAQIFRGDLEWAYRGVVHEYAVSLQATHTEGRLPGDYHVESRRLGDRNRAPDKYQRDCRLLLAYLADHPDDPRALFYLGQSYFDAGDPREALRHYTRRAELGDWPEEVYYALFRRAVCLERLAEPWSVCQDAYLAAWRARRTRAEPLHAIARRHRVDARYGSGYLFARAASEIEWPDDRLFVSADVYRWRSADERSICAYYTGRYRESIDLCARLLDSPHLPEAERDRVMGNRDLAVARVVDEEPSCPPAVIQGIVDRGPTTPPRVTLTVTSCKRPHLLARTLDSFLACCEDADQIGRWLLVDDGSTDEDRAWIAARYPFFECVWKDRAARGHARSMNLILDRLDGPYWLHLEDDWQFFVRDRYVTKALAILDDDPSLGQVLFNRNYGETLACRHTVGGVVKRTRREGLRYRVHEHVPPDSSGYGEAQRRLSGAANMLYWPHYSLRPSLVRVATIRDVGRYDPDAGHFEHEFAARYRDKGHQSAFLDAIHCLHLGRLTSERGPERTPNAYDLNNEPQFSGRRPGQVRRVKLVGEAAVNRADRWIRQARHDGEWQDIVVTRDDVDIDYFAVLGRPDGEPFDPGRSVVFPLEPGTDIPAADPAARLDRRGFIQVRTHDRYRHVGAWRLERSWAELVSRPIDKSRARSIAATVGEGSPGQRLGHELLGHLARHGVETSLHAGGDPASLLPYGYAIAVEGGARANYVTDVFFDALVAECLCFYWGCPNLEEHVDPSVFVRLPIEDVEASRRIVEVSVRDDLRARRLAAIRREKRRFLNLGQFVPTLARVIRGHEFVRGLPVSVLTRDRGPDGWHRFRRSAFEVAGAFVARCERVPAVDLGVWRTIANGSPAALVLEDDARPAEDFLGQLVEVCGLLCDEHPDFDVVLLGYPPRTEAQRRELSDPREVRLRPMTWSRFLGRAYGYLISRQGARTLLALAEREGVPDGLDLSLMRRAERLKVLQAVPRLIEGRE